MTTNRTRSVVRQMKVTCKLSAQYDKSCKRIMRRRDGWRPGRTSLHTKGIQKLMQLGYFSMNFVMHVIENWLNSLVLFKTYKYLKTVCVMNAYLQRCTPSKYKWSLPLITMRWENDHSSVGRNRSNLYSLTMNLNVINQTWVLVNNNTPFSNTRNPDLIKAFKLVKITFELFNFVELENVKNENETDAASAACFHNIKY